MLRSGYTLPVFACASAIAALRYLQGDTIIKEVSLNLITPPEIVNIPIEQGAKLSQTQALAITRSDPGDNLDLTRNTPIWALVEVSPRETPEIILKGGEGIGIQIEKGNKPAIYDYANRLIKANLLPYLQNPQKVIVTIILPEGRQLALRTSNSAFGVMDGLSLLGTTGISQPLTAPDQLLVYQEELKSKAQKYEDLVFCIGENGLDLAQKQGINPEQLVKTANWLGSMLVTAANHAVKSVLILGYHGKLIKLAGGIFHTHHHLADGRQEILIAHCVKVGIPNHLISTLWTCPTLQASLNTLKNSEEGQKLVNQLMESLGETLDHRCETYIQQHSENAVKVGSLWFDGDRQIVYISQTGQELLRK